MKRWLLSIKNEYKWFDIDEKEQLTFFADKFVKEGDVILIYKSSPLAQFSHLFTVKDSSRYEYANSEKERYKFKIYEKLALPKPIAISEIKESSILDNWIKNFPGFMYEIPDEIWLKFNDYLMDEYPELIECIASSKNEKPNKNNQSDELKEIIKNVNMYNVKNKKICRIPNEAVTEEAIINPILKCMGWDTSNPCEVRREYSIGHKKVDYALRNRTESKIFIEVKNFNSELNSENKDQIINYCLMENVELGILTNGKQWCFYHLNSKYNSLAKFKNICKIDFCKDKEDKIRELLTNLLSKEAVESGNASEYAQNLN